MIIARSGVMHLMRYLPVTRTTLEAISAYAENADRKCTLWHECRERAESMKNQGPNYAIKKKPAPWSYVAMFRVRGGRLYYDWPWGRKRQVHPSAGTVVVSSENCIKITPPSA